KVPKNLKEVHINTGPDDAGDLRDSHGTVRRRFGENVIYLVRPDQHIAARFSSDEADQLSIARDRAMAISELEAAQ
ncbi:MAG: hypothetical protein COB93_00595, partial [Sneathiella sp.]